MAALDNDRWRVVSPYLDRALEMTVEERVAWLAVLRAEDAALAADLQALLDERRALSQEGFLEGAAQPSLPQSSLAGQAVGAYTLVSPIGEGGMGSVWLARRSDGRYEGEAAVKLLNASLVGHSGGERFKREGSILARLTHPCIARLTDAGMSPMGQPYLVLEHVDGQRIDAWCDARALGIEARLRLFLDVLAAVAHAHANLIVHRDVKPSNVLVGADGRVKLLDFGIAKLLEGDAVSGDVTALTRDGGAVLTPEYAAPEQVTGEAVTTATDVYSLGVLLYGLLCGRHPSGATRSPAELLKWIVDTDPLRPSEAVTEGRTAPENAARRASTPERLRRLLRGDLDTIVAKAMKKKPQERYPSVGALADDLQRYLDKKPISARPDTLAYRSARFVGRHTRGVAAAGAVVLLLVGLVAFYTSRLAAERDRARLQAEKAAKVSELLTGLLTGADPYRTREATEPTVRSLLDAGAERIQKELAGEPELQAEMLTVIGRVYQQLGLHDKAKPLLERAVALGRSGPENERMAQSLHNLGILRREMGDLAASAALLEEALAMRRRILGPEHKAVADTLEELAYLCSLRGDKGSEPFFREALAIRRKVLGEEHRDTVSSLNDLGLLLLKNGDLAGAEPLMRQCLASNRKLLGEDHPDVATSMGNLALVLEEKGDHAEAEKLIRQALSISRKALGPRHLDIGFKLNNLAKPLRSQGKYDEAAAALEEALQITRPVLGDDHQRTIFFTVALALVRLEQGQARVAEPMLRHALQVRARTLPPGDIRISHTKSVLGAVLTKLARYDEAERLLVDVQSALKDPNAAGEEGRVASANLTRLAELYEAWGRPEQAARYRALVRPR